ncbi:MULTISPECIES: hypothetical protein [Pseudomonas]|uniref:hypothetical protein n=2 Tax=Pseudomonas TaxID=286 RepID=UPI00048C8748|nr:MULTISPECIES: hypothetical protein [Pseudomonas]MCE0876208.1 hypothetical protein [Pseudomonas monteilii]MCE0928915.1 hypothetical protein [Pseudomonas monteilii]MCE0934424.1 hypothetical protein [Pseudomonas monteilii]MCE0980285.1 hypothetical protein [Pseudomonas monteilii]MCE1014994.1 hypothetical protein [Pseudomonas monteilii]
MAIITAAVMMSSTMATILMQRHANGEPEHLISVFEDISAERQEHERLQAYIAALETRLAKISL